MPDETAESEIRKALKQLNMISAETTLEMEPLTGGVSSDIWRVALPDRIICVKRALAKLKVEADWRAPVGRNAYEVSWFKAAARLVPDAVPEVIAHDPAAGLFAMAYLDPGEYRLWKTALLAGETNVGAARAVAIALAAIHSGTAGDDEIAHQFPTDETFHAIRLEPYLEATARAHPDCAAALMALSERTAATKLALVHGDVSPKNILLGDAGPVFIDAECAWYGDPAFDAAFCLNHLLLKAIWASVGAVEYLRCFQAFAEAYLGDAAWEDRGVLEARIATLLPGLFLARIDGKSPVEYLTSERHKNQVRSIARKFLAAPVDELAAIVGAVEKEIAG